MRRTGIRTAQEKALRGTASLDAASFLGRRRLLEDHRLILFLQGSDGERWDRLGILEIDCEVLVESGAAQIPREVGQAVEFSPNCVGGRIRHHA